MDYSQQWIYAFKIITIIKQNLPSPQLKTSPFLDKARVWPSEPLEEEMNLMALSLGKVSFLGVGWLVESPSPRRP